MSETKRIVARSAMLLGGVILLASCAGDTPVTPADGAAMTFDVASPDRGTPHDGAASEVATSDGPKAADGTTAPEDGHLALDSETPTGCKLYSSWTCKEEKGALLCTTTCGDKRLSCTNGGICQCGLGIAPCSGTYSASNPCDVCRKAWLAGCCLY